MQVFFFFLIKKSFDRDCRILVSLLEIEYRPMEAQSPNQWTTREFLGAGSLIGKQE